MVGINKKLKSCLPKIWVPHKGARKAIPEINIYTGEDRVAEMEEKNRSA